MYLFCICLEHGRYYTSHLEDMGTFPLMDKLLTSKTAYMTCNSYRQLADIRV